MIYQESPTVELKREVTDDLILEIIAFLNSYLGGTIYVGVDDNGDIKGISKDKIDLEESRIINWIRDEGILPNCSDYINLRYNEDNVLEINVSPGKNKPYYLKGKGLKPSGVYIRYSRNKSQATEEEIRRMIRESSIIEYESLISEEQELTFFELEMEFRRRKLDFKKFKMVTSGFKTIDDKYTNLAFIFSDQYNINTKVAIYKGLTRAEFKNKKEFSGSIIRQIHEVLDYVYLCNETRVVIDGSPNREEYDSYPKEALREAIINCYCHRDYDRNSNIKIEFFDDRCEIISPGSFYDGLTLSDALQGVQSFRNINLVRLLYKLDLIENYASGFARIFRSYRDYNKKPQVDILNTAVKISLFNLNSFY